MKRNLPPLNSLKAFESAARNLSFSSAAKELFVTQGAISKQIKLLEEYLGLTVFVRYPHHIELTKSGKQFYTTIRDIFFQLENTVIDITGTKEENSVLTVSAVPSVATYWLLPRISDFSRKYKNIKVNVIIGDEKELDFSKSKADLAIRSSNTQIIGNIKKAPLFDENLILIYSNDMHKKNPIEKVQDILNFPILEHSSRDDIWDKFFKENSLEEHKPNRLIALEHFFMLIEATQKNMGLALVPEFLARNYLKNKVLFNPLGLTINSGISYYLAYPSIKEKQKKIQDFIIWMRAAIKSI